ncbi:protein kinase family protein [Solicola sp. PLA-1-18]|uniref:protein kinase family protein n=1 Tax=Solicola sp. PLA-1-18 TaxID=3380532 RepID=UPI003B813F19
MDTTTLSSGQVLGGRYALKDLINEGDGVSVWLAEDTSLHRSVGVSALSADDRRAADFLTAARASTKVTDPRFLRVMDAVEDEDGVTYLVREWARAFPLDVVLRESTMPSRRAATIVAEVAEALGNAHEAGVYHRELRPAAILLKASGAVRITGLAIDHVIAGHDPEVTDPQHAEDVDVAGVGHLLYACLTGRWPGSIPTSLRRAPTEHGRLMRPRQVRAGVARDVDTVCDRVLGTPPRHHETPLRTARDLAHQLHLSGEDDPIAPDDQPSLIRTSSPDVFRNDPVVVPLGPPPAINPPKPKPAALAPAPPSTFERSKARAVRATRGDRAWIVSGVLVALVLALSLAFIVGQNAGSTDTPTTIPSGGDDTRVQVEPLEIRRVLPIDPEGQDDGQENNDEAGLAVDGDRATGWRTSEYYGSADLAGLKRGVGLVVDLGEQRNVHGLQLTLGGEPTSLAVYASPPGETRTPRSIRGLQRLGNLDGTGPSASFSNPPAQTRFVVIWLTELPEVRPGVFQGQVDEVEVRGTP